MPASEHMWVDESWRERLLEAGLLDFDAVLARDDFEAVKTKLEERQVHRLRLKDGAEVYVKRYFAIGLREALRDALFASGYASGVSREWLALEKLAQLGITAARPLVAAERKSAGLVRSGYLVTEGLELAGSLESLLYDEAAPLAPAAMRTLVIELADLARRMHEGGLNHRDFYIGHLMIDARSRELVVMDLNRADCRPSVPRRWRVKDLAALDVSTPVRLVPQRERLRFLAHYLSGLRDAPRLIREIEAKSRKMKRHAENKIRRGAANFHVNR